MLSTFQKAEILRRSGVSIPVRPSELSPAAREADERSADAEAAVVAAAMLTWSAVVDTLFVTFSVARAAKSLREAEEARQLENLRAMVSSITGMRPRALR